jgi:DUF971 family protein
MNKPTQINYRKNSKTLVLTYATTKHELSAEFLRVHSPSAEVRGHGPQEAILQVEKKSVSIIALETVGNYALKITFDDGHDSGLFTWEYLLELGENKDHLWQAYLQQLDQAGAKRESDIFFKSSD